MRFGEIGETLLEVLKRLHSMEVNLIDGSSREMEMGVLETGDDEVSLEVDYGGIWGCKRLNVPISTDCDDRVAAHGQSLGLWL